MNYFGMQDIEAGASAGFKAFYNGETAAKTVNFTTKSGEVITGLKLQPGLLPIQSREVTSAEAGVFGLY